MTGLVIGNYRIIDRLGDGGQGKVYRALDTMVEREVAIKALRPEIARESETLERFRKEAITLAKLNHPAIAQLYTFFRDGDNFYMVMEYIPGRTLETIIQEQGPAPWQRAVSIAAAILDAIGFAHGMGILHRDLKPANIMLTPDGRVKVMDFGIAQVLGGPKMTREGRVVGTVEYLAPERIRGNPPDKRADLYSLGVVLFEMLTGKLPFTAGNEYEMMMAQLNERPKSPVELGIDLPPAVLEILTTALEKDPDQRYPDAATFAAALRSLTPTAQALIPSEASTEAAVKPVPTVKPSLGPKAGLHFHWLKNPRAQWTAGLLGAFLLVFLVSLLMFGGKQEDPWKQASAISPSVPADSSGVQPAPVAQPPITFDPTPIPVPGPPQPQEQPPPTNTPPAPTKPAPRQEQPPVPREQGLSPEQRRAVAAALERTEGTPGGTSGFHPIHLIGVLGALAAGGRAASPDIQQAVATRGVNFRLNAATTQTLTDANATPELVRTIGENYRAPMPPNDPPPVPVEPAVPKEPAPKPPTRIISSIKDVRRIFIEKLEGDLDEFIRNEIQNRFGEELKVTSTLSGADAVMQVSIEQLKGGSLSKAGRLFGLSDKRRVQARIVDAATRRTVLWEERAGDRNLMTGPFIGDGVKRLASRIVKALQDEFK